MKRIQSRNSNVKLSYCKKKNNLFSEILVSTQVQSQEIIGKFTIHTRKRMSK